MPCWWIARHTSALDRRGAGRPATGRLDLTGARQLAGLPVQGCLRGTDAELHRAGSPVTAPSYGRADLHGHGHPRWDVCGDTAHPPAACRRGPAPVRRLCHAHACRRAAPHDCRLRNEHAKDVVRHAGPRAHAQPLCATGCRRAAPAAARARAVWLAPARCSGVPCCGPASAPQPGV